MDKLVFRRCFGNACPVRKLWNGSLFSAHFTFLADSRVALPNVILIVHQYYLEQWPLKKRCLWSSPIVICNNLDFRLFPLSTWKGEEKKSLCGEFFFSFWIWDLWLKTQSKPNFKCGIITPTSEWKPWSPLARVAIGSSTLLSRTHTVGCQPRKRAGREHEGKC